MRRITAPGSGRTCLRYVMIVPWVVLMVLMSTGVSHAILGINPKSISAVKGQNTTVHLTWQISGEASGLWTSTNGTFEDISGAPYGSPTGPLSINVSASGNGSVTESLLIPSSVVNTVAQSGQLSFLYSRDFAAPPIVGGLVSDSLSIRIVISQTAGPLSLRRIELYFEQKGKRTNEITVARNTSGLSALADLHVNGTGYIEGHWEVNGRRIENIREFASFGSKVTVRTSEVPGIPTFRPGLHSVRLVITNPAPGFTLPRIGYIVTSGAAEVVRVLRPTSPGEGEEVNGDTVFAWDPGEGAAYVLTFIRDPDGEVVLTAQTKDTGYRIPARLLADRFSPGAAYLWQIKGYGADGQLISESKPKRIILGE